MNAPGSRRNAEVSITLPRRRGRLASWLLGALAYVLRPFGREPRPTVVIRAKNFTMYSNGDAEFTGKISAGAFTAK